MDSYYKKMIIEEIKDIRCKTVEEILLMLKYVIQAYIYSLFTFGANNKVTIDVKNIWNQFKQILREEKNIHKFILRNSDLISAEEVYDLLDKMSDVNDDTVEYYYNALDDILDACETKCEDRAAHYKRDFLTLIETDEYKIEASGLALNFDNIKEFLNYSQDFWNFVTPKIRMVDSRIKENEILYVTLISSDCNGLLQDIRVIVPEIVDLKTACINIHEFKHAYDLYLQMGKRVDESETHCEEDAVNLEKEFKKTYVLNKFYSK